MGLLLAERGH
jgi:hypothetical protein